MWILWMDVVRYGGSLKLYPSCSWTPRPAGTFQHPDRDFVSLILTDKLSMWYVPHWRFELRCLGWTHTRRSWPWTSEFRSLASMSSNPTRWAVVVGCKDEPSEKQQLLSPSNSKLCLPFSKKRESLRKTPKHLDGGPKVPGAVLPQVVTECINLAEKPPQETLQIRAFWAIGV